MIRTIVALAVAGFALSPFTDKDDQYTAIHGIDPIITSAEAAAPVIAYYVSAPSGASCRIELTGAAGDLKPVHADPACADVHEGLENAARWSTAADGTASVSDGQGRTILHLAVSDGFAWESLDGGPGPLVLSEAD